MGTRHRLELGECRIGIGPQQEQEAATLSSGELSWFVVRLTVEASRPRILPVCFRQSVELDGKVGTGKRQRRDE